IRPPVDVFSQVLLGSHIRWRTNNGRVLRKRRAARSRSPRSTVTGYRFRLDRVRQPKIGDTNATIPTDENVLGLEVTVDEARRVPPLPPPRRRKAPRAWRRAAPPRARPGPKDPPHPPAPGRETPPPAIVQRHRLRPRSDARRGPSPVLHGPAAFAFRQARAPP